MKYLVISIVLFPMIVFAQAGVSEPPASPAGNGPTGPKTPVAMEQLNSQVNSANLAMQQINAQATMKSFKVLAEASDKMQTMITYILILTVLNTIFIIAIAFKQLKHGNKFQNYKHLDF